MKLKKNAALLLSGIILALLLVSFIGIAFPKQFSSGLRPLLYICTITGFLISAYFMYSLFYLFKEKEIMSYTYAKILDDQQKSLSQLSEFIDFLDNKANLQMPSLETLNSLKEQKKAEAQNNVKTVNEVCENSNEVEIELDTINTLILEIKSNSQNIKGVIRVIDDIAFQTNILALNAAVEAARAGESGQGFAVVADQVKELAQKAASAASKTGDLINEAITNIQKGEQVSNKIVEKQKQKSEESRKAKIAFTEFHSSFNGFLKEIENFRDEYDSEKNALTNFIDRLSDLKAIFASLEEQQTKLKNSLKNKVTVKSVKKPKAAKAPTKKQKKVSKAKVQKVASKKKVVEKPTTQKVAKKIINTAQPTEEEAKVQKFSFENRKKTDKNQKDSPEITKPEEVLPLDDFDGF